MKQILLLLLIVFILGCTELSNNLQVNKEMNWGNFVAEINEKWAEERDICHEQYKHLVFYCAKDSYPECELVPECVKLQGTGDTAVSEIETGITFSVFRDPKNPDLLNSFTRYQQECLHYAFFDSTKTLNVLFDCDVRKFEDHGFNSRLYQEMQLRATWGAYEYGVTDLKFRFVGDPVELPEDKLEIIDEKMIDLNGDGKEEKLMLVQDRARSKTSPKVALLNDKGFVLWLPLEKWNISYLTDNEVTSPTLIVKVTLNIPSYDINLLFSIFDYGLNIQKVISGGSVLYGSIDKDKFSGLGDLPYVTNVELVDDIPSGRWDHEIEEDQQWISDKNRKINNLSLAPKIFGDTAEKYNEYEMLPVYVSYRYDEWNKAENHTRKIIEKLGDDFYIETSGKRGISGFLTEDGFNLLKDRTYLNSIGIRNIYYERKGQSASIPAGGKYTDDIEKLRIESGIQGPYIDPEVYEEVENGFTSITLVLPYGQRTEVYSKYIGEINSTLSVEEMKDLIVMENGWKFKASVNRNGLDKLKNNQNIKHIVLSG